MACPSILVWYNQTLLGEALNKGGCEFLRSLYKSSPTSLGVPTSHPRSAVEILKEVLLAGWGNTESDCMAPCGVLLCPETVCGAAAVVVVIALVLVVLVPPEERRQLLQMYLTNFVTASADPSCRCWRFTSNLARRLWGRLFMRNRNTACTSAAAGSGLAHLEARLASGGGVDDQLRAAIVRIRSLDRLHVSLTGGTQVDERFQPLDSAP